MRRVLSTDEQELTGSSGHFQVLDSSDGIPPDGVAVMTLGELVPPSLVDGLQGASLKELAGDGSSS